MIQTENAQQEKESINKVKNSFSPSKTWAKYQLHSVALHIVPISLCHRKKQSRAHRNHKGTFLHKTEPTKRRFSVEKSSFPCAEKRLCCFTQDRQQGHENRRNLFFPIIPLISLSLHSLLPGRTNSADPGFWSRRSRQIPHPRMESEVGECLFSNFKTWRHRN